MPVVPMGLAELCSYKMVVREMGRFTELIGFEIGKVENEKKLEKVKSSNVWKGGKD